MNTAVRRMSECGHSKLDWLESRFTFSFAEYQDPKHMGFRTLRVMNHDWIQPSKGFDFHPHRDMEIITYIIRGEIEHKDNQGHHEVLKRGQIQRMSAGTGIVHSEFNASSTELLELYQIWILPVQRGIEPGYQTESFEPGAKRNELNLIGARDRVDGALEIHQDVRLFNSFIDPSSSVTHITDLDRHIWIQAISGRLRVGEQILNVGDGVSISKAQKIEIHSEDDSEILLFDLG